jgi:Zn-dependent M28 family amino/carboxypeptidase
MMAVAKLIAALPRPPKRTIRIVLFGSEEVGLIGGMAYAKAHKDELAHHVLASESDFGGETIWRLRTRFGPGAAAYARAMAGAVSDLAIPASAQPAEGESEVGLLAGQGVPVFDLDADGTKYFDIHHTPNDVISGVDPATLRQNVAAYAALAYIAAESDWDFRRK